VRRPNQPPWCPECEWNLAARNYPDRYRRPGRSARRARLHAFELNRRSYAELRHTRPARALPTRSRAVIAAASAVLLLVDVALLGVGVYLLATGAAGYKILAAFLLLVGIECRPRFPRMPKDVERVTPEAAPHLFALIEQARVAVGAPPIDVVVVSNEMNAFCTWTGFRRRTVLGIGLTLWGALSPSARLALLGHELGHLINHDPTRAFTSQPALTTFGRLAEVFDPRGMARRPGQGGVEVLMIPASYVLFMPLHLFFRWVQLALLRVAARDHQRAEIYADALAVELGGSTAADELMHVSLFGRSIRSAVQRAAIGGSADPVEWRSAASAVLASRRPHARVAEQESLRMDVSGYATHPPTGLRLRLVSSWPAFDGKLEIPEATFAAADAELAAEYEEARRALRDS
jgi:Zn-dependent protease with chaperone function